jgi:diguanylate cyclase (GGDEF)-like protein
LRKNGSRIGLALLVVLPLLISAIGMFWSTSYVLNGISVSVNKQEEERAWQAVNSAMDAARSRLAGTVADNARWDDAVIHTYGTPDQEWIKDTWGDFTDATNYNAAFIVTPDGKTIAAYANRKAVNLTAEQYLGPQLQKILRELTNVQGGFATKSTLAATPLGFAIVSAGPILPSSDEIQQPSRRANLLIYGQTLSIRKLKEISSQYTIDNLIVLPAASANIPNARILTDAWGAPAFSAVWRNRTPGDAAKQVYMWTAATLIAFLLAAMLPVSIVHFLALRRLDHKEQQAHRDARLDAMSSLPNRISLLEELDAGLRSSNPGELALLFIDLDGFKAVNDAYDHATGDKLIAAFAAGLRVIADKGEVLARLGGDEFAILVSSRKAAFRSQKLAEAVLKFVHEPFDINGRTAAIGASIGIAELGTDPVTPAELMRRADIAMYEAKENGRNQWRQFDPELDRKRSDDFQIAREMREFIARGEFGVAYQPIISAGDRKIVGVEALARWPTRSSRRLEPSQFIPVAEEHGLIRELGAIIFNMACRDVSAWQDMRLSINVSAAQLTSSSFVQDLKEIAEKHGMSPHRIEVEFTEAILKLNARRAKNAIKELHAEGFTVALDDFGTGHASVHYLQDFAFDRIKLDRSMTKNVAYSRDAQKVVQGTILIAQGLSADIVAEGIETEEDAKIMRLAGCQQMQGYYFGRPQSSDTLRFLIPPPKVKAANSA